MKPEDLRLDQIKAVVEKAVTDMKKKTDLINMRLDLMNRDINARFKAVDTKIDAVNTRIDSVEKRIDDFKDAQNQGLTRLGLIIALGVGLIQVITVFVLQFWK